MKSISCLIFAYGKMREYLAQKRQASLNSFDNGFHGFMESFKNTKSASYFVLFGKLMQNIFDKKWF